jgi:hypothetical protein
VTTKRVKVVLSAVQANPLHYQGVRASAQMAAGLGLGLRRLTLPVEIVAVEVYSIMRFRAALFLASFFMVCFTIAVCLTPASAEADEERSREFNFR